MPELWVQMEVAWSQSLAAQPFEPSPETRMPVGRRCFDPLMGTAAGWALRHHLPRSRWVRGSGVLAWSRGCKVGMADEVMGQAAHWTLLPAHAPGKVRG